MAELLLVDYGCLRCSKRFVPGEIMHFTMLGHADAKEPDGEAFNFAMSTCGKCAQDMGEEFTPSRIWAVDEVPTEPTWPKLFGNAVLGGAACFIFRLDDGTHIVLTAHHQDHTCAVIVPVQSKPAFEEQLKHEDLRISADGTKRWVKSLDGGTPPDECTRKIIDCKVKDLTAVRSTAQAAGYGFVGLPIIATTTEYAQ